MSNLVRRLRGYPGKRGMEKPPHVTMDEAADYIEKLEASESEWQPICDSYAAENQRFSDRIEKLEAVLEVATMKRIINIDRIEKLEAALQELLSLGEWGTNALARTIILEALDKKN
jgi:hypothetical protein